MSKSNVNAAEIKRLRNQMKHTEDRIAFLESAPERPTAKDLENDEALSLAFEFNISVAIPSACKGVFNDVRNKGRGGYMIDVEPDERFVSHDLAGNFTLTLAEFARRFDGNFMGAHLADGGNLNIKLEDWDAMHADLGDMIFEALLNSGAIPGDAKQQSHEILGWRLGHQ